MSDTSFGAELGSGRGHGVIDLEAELSGRLDRQDAGFGRAAPAGWWIAIVVMGGAAGWVSLIAAVVT